jgi:ABC-type nitrate/sulfonate/bicarbonate transport system substrate-binding protein
MGEAPTNAFTEITHPTPRIIHGEGLHRRQFLNLTTLTAAAALTGCHRHHAGDLTMALGWVPDVEYADLWVALDRNYIANAGLHFKYLPGGPNAPQPVLEISAREADFGDSDWLPFCDAITQGNDFVILASLFPITPIGLLSLPSNPIHTPADLAHKRFLVQGPNERAILQALFRINNLPETYTMVPVGFSPEPLLQGAGDAYFCFVTNHKPCNEWACAKEPTSTSPASTTFATGSPPHSSPSNAKPLPTAAPS